MSSTTNPDEIDDDYVLSLISPLTDGQEIALSLLSVFSTALSIVGSSTIILRVINKADFERRGFLPTATGSTSPYDRMMLALSITDIVASISYGLSPFLLPVDTSQRVWAIGSDGTCTFLGWLTQFSFCAIWYNCMLSFYYLLTVRFGMTREVFVEKYELLIHVVTVFYFLVTATVGAILGWYQEFQVTMGCWVGEIPAGCEAAGTCTGIGQLVGWILGGFPMLSTFVVLIVNNAVIYCFVRKHLNFIKGGIADKSNTPSRDVSIKSQVSGFSSRTTSSKGATSSDIQNALMLSRQMEERRFRQAKQIHEVASQGFLYVVTFFLSYTPAFLIRVLDGLGFGSSDEGKIYPLLVVNAFLLPLQGFFNMFVHTRPNFLRLRAAYPEISTMRALKRACFDADIPRYDESILPSSHYGLSGPDSADQPQLAEGGGAYRRSRFSSSLGSGNLEVLQEGSHEDDSSRLSSHFSSRDFQTASDEFHNTKKPAAAVANKELFPTIHSEVASTESAGRSSVLRDSLFKDNSSGSGLDTQTIPPIEASESSQSAKRLSMDGEVTGNGA